MFALCATQNAARCALSLRHTAIFHSQMQHITQHFACQTWHGVLERVLPLQTAERLAVFEHNAHPMLLCDAATEFVNTRSLHGGFRSSAVARPFLKLCFEAQPERQLLHVVSHGETEGAGRFSLPCVVSC